MLRLSFTRVPRCPKFHQLAISSYHCVANFHSGLICSGLCVGARSPLQQRNVLTEGMIHPLMATHVALELDATRKVRGK